jgi:hypothetical protein
VSRYAASNSTGSITDGSSFSGLLTRVEIGHPHRASRERPHQVARIRLVAKPPGIVARGEDEGIRLWMLATNSFASVVMSIPTVKTARVLGRSGALDALVLTPISVA